MSNMSQAMTVLTSQTSQEWYTPKHVITWVCDILGGIELDPASCIEANKVVLADRIYTITDNGYNKQWEAKTIFLNPPFTATSLWLDKMAWQYAKGNFAQGIALINSAPGYKWFEQLWRDRTICMLRERLRFISSDGYIYGQAKKGQALVYFGIDDSKFAEILLPHGRVLRQV